MLEETIPPASFKHINSDNLSAEISALSKINNGRVDGVGLFGSTHAQAKWRQKILQRLDSDAITSYNPQLPDTVTWDTAKHPQAEALALNEFSVLAFRLENEDINNGSLGSITEIGMALTSAILHGQKILISIENNFEASMKEPGAVVQYEALESWLTDMQKFYPQLISVDRGDDLEEFGNKIVRAANEQRRSPNTLLSEDDIKNLKADDPLEKSPKILLGGSAKPFSSSLESKFSQTIKTINRIVEARHKDRIIVLTRGGLASDWNEAFADLSGSQREQGIKKVKYNLLHESTLKQGSDLVIWPIQKEAASKGAMAEIGFLIANSLRLGQRLAILVEPFDSDVFIRAKMKDSLPGIKAELIEIHGKLNDPLELEKALEVLKQIETGNLDSLKFFNLFQLSYLQQLSLFQECNNTKKVRAIIEAHLKILQKHLTVPSDGKSEPWFIYSTNEEEFMNKLEQMVE